MAPQRSAKLGKPSLDPPEVAEGDSGEALEAFTGGDAALFTAAGPFEPYPGAVLLVGRGGRVLSATTAAQALVGELAAGAASELEDAVAAAIDGKAAQINPLSLTNADGEAGCGRAYDVVALPWIRGASALVIARDITLERSLRAALIESRQRYKDLVEASGDFAWETDDEGRFTFVSPCGAVGYAAGQLVGQHAEDIVLETDDASPFAARVRLEGAEVWVRAADGKPACLATVAVPLADAEGRWCGARGVCREVADERGRSAGPAARPAGGPDGTGAAADLTSCGSGFPRRAR